MKKQCVLCGLGAGLVLLGVVEARDPGAPPTRVAPVADVYHGVSVEDPYRWLENGSDSEVRAWTSAQTARTRAYLDALSSSSAVGAHLNATDASAPPALTTK